MIFTHEITLDMTYNEIKIINIKQYTKDSFLLHVNLTDRGEPFRADKNNLICQFKMETPNGNFIFTDGIINDDGSVDIYIPEKACLTAGSGTAEVVFATSEIASDTNSTADSVAAYGTHSQNGVAFATMNLSVNIIASSYNNSHITSSDDFDALHSALLAANKTYDYVMTSANASANAAKKSEDNAAVSEHNAAASANNAASSEHNAAVSKDNAAYSALLAQSYAVGGTGLNGRENEDEECAKIYCEIANDAKNDSANSALLAQSYAVGGSGTRPGEDKDSAKHYYEESQKIYKNFNQAGTVTGIKGAAESDFRTGNVTLTSANIGSPSNEYMQEHFVADYVSSVRENVGSQGIGWYRIAKAEFPYYNSCLISLKRAYNTPAPEYQKIQLINVYSNHKFINLVACSENHIWTKIRETWDEEKTEAYIEIYLNYVSENKSNTWRISIEDTLSTETNCEWKAIAPVKTEETVSGVTVLASLDLPANFDLSYLVNKNGDTINGLLKFIQNGSLRFIAPNVAENAMGIEFHNKDQSSMFGGIGVHSKSGIPDRVYMGAGTNAPWNPANGLSITADSIKWKNSNVVTEAAGKAKEAVKATQDGDGNVIVDAYLSKTDASNTYLKKTGGTITGNLTLKGSSNYGNILNFGDGDYVHISEPTDDHLEIKGSYINFVTSNSDSGRFTLNGKDILSYKDISQYVISQSNFELQAAYCENGVVVIYGAVKAGHNGSSKIFSISDTTYKPRTIITSSFAYSGQSDYGKVKRVHLDEYGNANAWTTAELAYNVTATFVYPARTS